MRVAIFGATGPTGQLLVQRALEAGHEVTVFVRNPQKLRVRDARLKVVQGDLKDAAAVASAVAGAGAVISLLGPTGAKVTGRPLTVGMQHLVQAMREHGVNRLLALATPSADEAQDQPGLLLRCMVQLMRRLLPAAYEEIRGLAQVVRESGLDWTLVRVAVLHNGPATWPPRVGPVGPGVGLKVARATIVAFMLDELSAGHWMRQAPALSDA